MVSCLLRDLHQIFRYLGDAHKLHFAGHRTAVLTRDPRLASDPSGDIGTVVPVAQRVIHERFLEPYAEVELD